MQHFVLERKVPEGDDVEARVEEDEEEPVEEERQGEKKRCCSCAEWSPCATSWCSTYASLSPDVHQIRGDFVLFVHSKSAFHCEDRDRYHDCKPC